MSPTAASDRGCRLLPPAPAPPMGSADRSKIDGIVVPEKGARSCVECRATTTPMWRSGPTGPRVDSTIIESCHSETSMLFEGPFSEVSSFSGGQMFEVDLTMEELLSIN